VGETLVLNILGKPSAKQGAIGKPLATSSKSASPQPSAQQK